MRVLLTIFIMLSVNIAHASDLKTGGSGQSNGNQVSIPKVGSPTLVTTVDDLFTYGWSAAVMKGGDLANNGDGSVNISSGEALLRSSASGTAPLYSLTFPSANNLALTDQSINYLWVDFNSGNPQVGHSTNSGDYNCWDKCHLYTVFREGIELHILDGRKQNIDFNRNARVKAYKTNPFAHVLGGTVLSNPTDTRIAVTSGMFYYAYNQISHSAFDTTVAGTATANVFDYAYTDGVNWFQVHNNKFIDTTQWNNPLVGLVALTDTYYKVDWAYLAIGITSELIFVYGTSEYATLQDARNAPAPASLPPVVNGVGQRIGRVISQKGVSPLIQIDSEWSNLFSASGVPKHNDLSNIQGGATDEYFHLTGNEYNNIGALLDNPPSVITRTTSTVSATSAVPNCDTTDVYTITALAAGTTFEAPVCTPVNGQKIMIRIKDNGNPRAISWNGIYRAIGITLPNTTTASKILYVGAIYNQNDVKWDVIATAQEQ